MNKTSGDSTNTTLVERTMSDPERAARIEELTNNIEHDHATHEQPSYSKLLHESITRADLLAGEEKRLMQHGTPGNIATRFAALKSKAKSKTINPR
jgi:hypothetical protein